MRAGNQYALFEDDKKLFVPPGSLRLRRCVTRGYSKHAVFDGAPQDLRNPPLCNWLDRALISHCWPSGWQQKYLRKAQTGAPAMKYPLGKD